MKQVSFKKKLKLFKDKHKLHAVSSNIANSGVIDTKIREHYHVLYKRCMVPKDDLDN